MKSPAFKIDVITSDNCVKMVVRSVVAVRAFAGHVVIWNYMLLFL